MFSQVRIIQPETGHDFMKILSNHPGICVNVNYCRLVRYVPKVLDPLRVQTEFFETHYQYFNNRLRFSCCTRETNKLLQESIHSARTKVLLVHSVFVTISYSSMITYPSVHNLASCVQYFHASVNFNMTVNLPKFWKNMDTKHIHNPPVPWNVFGRKINKEVDVGKKISNYIISDITTYPILY